MMTPHPSLLRRIYNAVALFGLLNLLVAACVAGYFGATGALDGDKLRKAVMALRGIAPPAPPAPQPTPTAPPVEAGPKSAELETDEDVEMAYRETERIKTELQQRLALSNSVLLKVQQEREAFQKERAEAERQKEAAATEQHDQGFVKQVAILAALSPKAAVEHLLAMGDVDESARVLAAMETGKAKKIIEAAKRGDDVARMKAIVQRVREVAPTRLAAGAGEED